MLRSLRFITFQFFLLTSVCTLYGQVTGVDYQLKFDSTTCLYDAYIIINEGNAVSAIQRTQFSSQFSVVVPTGSICEITETYMPLKNNQTGTGTVPQNWNIGSIVYSPDTMPISDFYGITPSLSPVAQYNTLNVGDTIRIFSLNIIAPNPNCGAGIRMFENGVDPPSSAEGMNGGDFSNGFTIGGVAQRYQDNSPQLNPPKPIIEDLSYVFDNDLFIDLSSITSVCQGPLSCSWTGPNNYSGNEEDVLINNPTAANEGMYTVNITDLHGCVSTTSTMVTTSGDPCSEGDHSSKVWNGSINGDWFTPENWTPCGIPQLNTDVFIPSGTTSYPLVNSTTTIKSLTILEGGYMEVQGLNTILYIIN